MYYMIYQSNTRIFYLKVNRCRGNNPKHDIIKHLLTPDLRWFKIKKQGKKRQYHWAYQLLLSPHKPNAHRFYIEVKGIITKKYTIQSVAIYNSLQDTICQFNGFTYKTLGHTHPGIYTAAEMNEYIPCKKGVELERNLSFNLLIINHDNHWETRT